MKYGMHQLLNKLSKGDGIIGNEVLHEYRGKNGDLVRVRESRSGEVYIDSYTGDERSPEEHGRDTIKISSGDGKPSGHGTNHSPLRYRN